MKFARIIFMGIIATILLSGCGTVVNKEMEKVTVVLDYLPNTNHTGLYVALDRGYFKDEGLEVNIVQPSEGATNTLIAVGKGDFGITYQEDVTYALTAIDPLPIKAIATLLQHNTSGFASFKDKNILSPIDYVGKVYSGWGSPAEEAVLKAVIKQAGGNPDDITIIAGGGGISTLADKVDLNWIFYGWTGIQAELDGFPLNYQPLNELDPRLDYYTPVIVAANETLENKPEMVKAFLRATEKGYEDCITNPKETAIILNKYATEYSEEFLVKSQEYLSPFYKENGIKWGEMKDEVWNGYTEFMTENGLIDKALDPKDAYTNDFLPKQ